MDLVLLILIGNLSSLFAFYFVSDAGELFMFSSGMLVLLLVLYLTSSSAFTSVLVGLMGFILGGILTIIRNRLREKKS